VLTTSDCAGNVRCWSFRAGKQSGRKSADSGQQFFNRRGLQSGSRNFQHINTFTRFRGGDWLYTFTEEIPVSSQKHQFSFALPVQKVGSFSGERGIGDISINYRYQLVANKKTAVAPRFSLLLPTGNYRKERGAGGVGFQFNLPVSVQFSKKFSRIQTPV